MLRKRILGDGVPLMPQSELDPAAETLLRAYIAELTSRPTYAEWQTTHFPPDGPLSPQAAPTADPDADGAPNRLEYLAATPPTSPNANPLAINLVTTPTPAPGGEYIFTFLHPAARSAIVETSTDLATWTRWLVPGNTPTWPATDTPRELRAPVDADRRFFRLRLDER